MKKSKCAVLALGATLFACDAEDADVDSQYDTLGNRDAGRSAADAGHGDWEGRLACKEPKLKDCADGQIVAIVTAANKGEVTLSKALRAKLSTEDAQHLADHLAEKHAKAQTELEALIASTGIRPVQNANSAHLEEMNALTLAALEKKTGVALDDSFVTHQLVTHAQVLGTLDHVLIPSVKSPELEAYLRKVREEVGTHTETIAKTQAALKGPCGGDATSDAGVGAAPTGPVVIDAGTRP